MTISLRPRGPFSLPLPLHLALTDDGGEAVAFRAVWAEEAGEVEVDFVSDLPAERVERHAARVLSLDVDGSGLAEVGERDPVIPQPRRAQLQPATLGGQAAVAELADARRSGRRELTLVEVRVLSAALGPVATLAAGPRRYRLGD